MWLALKYEDHSDFLPAPAFYKIVLATNELFFFGVSDTLYIFASNMG